MDHRLDAYRRKAVVLFEVTRLFTDHTELERLPAKYSCIIVRGPTLCCYLGTLRSEANLFHGHVVSCKIARCLCLGVTSLSSLRDETLGSIKQSFRRFNGFFAGIL